MTNAPRFAPTRAAAVQRLDEFLPEAGQTYAERRNFDLPGHDNVSRLSPYLRHRIVTEGEVLRAVLARHGSEAGGKFIDEVFWRIYFKGWLELRPAVWFQYREGVRRGMDRIATEAGLRAEWETACRGETGIACFDHWAQELAETGYLHNHARMWFASIWVFTLRLPWELGADFFLRHLLDGDAASNTLGWRWVAGLQTRGKTYLAEASNIRRFTGGRFDPAGELADEAPMVEGPDNPAPQDLPACGAWDSAKRTGLLLTEDDLSPGFLLDQGLEPAAIAGLQATEARSPLKPAAKVTRFEAAALEEALQRIDTTATARANIFTASAAPKAILDWAKDNALTQIVAPYPPVGPARDALARAEEALRAVDISLVQVRRAEDTLIWPYATKGFFRFRQNIPDFLRMLG